GLLAAEHRRLRLANHLDVPEGKLELVAAEVEVVEPEGLLVDGRVLLTRERQDRDAVVEHEVPPYLVGAVGEPVLVLVACRLKEQLRRVGRTAGDDDEIAGEGLGRAVAPKDPAGARLAGPDR